MILVASGRWQSGRCPMELVVMRTNWLLLLAGGRWQPGVYPMELVLLHTNWLGHHGYQKKKKNHKIRCI